MPPPGKGCTETDWLGFLASNPSVEDVATRLKMDPRGVLAETTLRRLKDPAGVVGKVALSCKGREVAVADTALAFSNLDAKSTLKAATVLVNAGKEPSQLAAKAFYSAVRDNPSLSDKIAKRADPAWAMRFGHYPTLSEAAVSRLWKLQRTYRRAHELVPGAMAAVCHPNASDLVRSEAYTFLTYHGGLYRRPHMTAENLDIVLAFLEKSREESPASAVASLRAADLDALLSRNARFEVRYALGRGLADLMLDLPRDSAWLLLFTLWQRWDGPLGDVVATTGDILTPSVSM
jgi:hypothetical protein